MGSWSCLTNLISHDKVSSLVIKERLGMLSTRSLEQTLSQFPMAFLLKKLPACGLDTCPGKRNQGHLQDERQSIITNQALVPWYCTSVDCLSQGQFIRMLKGWIKQLNLLQTTDISH